MKTARKALAATLAAFLMLQPAMASFAETLPLPAAAEAEEAGFEEAVSEGEETVPEASETEESSVLKTEGDGAGAPVILVQPSDQTVKAGETAVFSVQAEGEGLSYQWQYQFKEETVWKTSKLETGKSAELYVPAKASWEGMKFRCVVTDAAGASVKTETAALLLEEPEETIKITEQPADQTVKAGETAVFSVRAEGEGLSYQWQYQMKDETVWKLSKLETGKTADLSVPAKASWEGMKFRCVITDASGDSVKTETATLFLEEPEITFKITEQPADQTVKAGETAVFSVKAEGEGLSYQWQYQVKNETTWKTSKLETGKSADLCVPAKASWEGMKFRCLVKDASGDFLMTDAAVLSLLASVEITEQPQDQAVAAGETAAFSVKATGKDLKYQWQYQVKGQEIWKSSTQATGRSAELTFTMVSSWDGMKFRCVVTDSSKASVTSEEAVLTLKTALTITEQPADQAAKAGKTAVFSVKAAGTELQYQWQSSKNGKTWADMEGAAEASCSVTVADTLNGYRWRCVVTDAFRQEVISSAAKLTVKPALKISTQPKSQSAKTGKTVTFSVKAAGEGLSYQWQAQLKNGTEWEQSTESTGKAAALTVTAGVTAGNGTKFRCIVTDSDGDSVISDIAALTVTDVFEILQQPEDQSVSVGETVTFRVEATGTGLKYQWQSSKDGTDWSKVSGATKTWYSVKASSANNGNQYRCVITNSAKQSITSSAAKLSAKQEPLEITKQPEGQIAASGARVTFSVEATGTGLTYQWQSSKNGTSWSKVSGATKASCTVTVNTSSNGRQFRCVVTDASGNTVTSSAAVLTMKQALKITKQPASRTVRAGAAAVFSVTAAGNGLQYQWQYLAKTGDWTDSTLETAATASLAVSAEASLSGYKYRCVITDSYGSTVTSRAVTLTVISK